MDRRRRQRGRARRHARGEHREAQRAALRARPAGAPSWQRTFRRGAIFAPIMFGTVFLLSPELPLATKLTQTLLIVAIFVPFSYFIDRFFYRSGNAAERTFRKLIRTPMLRVEQLSLGRWTSCYVALGRDVRRGNRRRSERRCDRAEAHAGANRNELRGDPRHHGHWDHLLGVADAAQGTGARRWPHGRGRALVPREPTACHSCGRHALRPYTPDVLLHGGETIAVAGIDFQVLSVPGHSPAHLAYYADGCLFSGDMPLRGLGRADGLPGSDWETLLASIAVLRDTALPRRPSSIPGTAPSRPSATSSRRTRFLAELRAGAAREPRAEDRASPRHPRRPSRQAAPVAPASAEIERLAPCTATDRSRRRCSRTRRSSNGRPAPARTWCRRKSARSPG